MTWTRVTLQGVCCTGRGRLHAAQLPSVHTGPQGLAVWCLSLVSLTFAWLKPPLQIGPHLDGTIRSYNSSGMRQSQWIVS